MELRSCVAAELWSCDAVGVSCGVVQTMRGAAESWFEAVDQWKCGAAAVSRGCVELRCACKLRSRRAVEPGSSAELWGCGAVGLWSCGVVELWSYGTLELGICGAVRLWSCGPVDLWTCRPVDALGCGADVWSWGALWS